MAPELCQRGGQLLRRLAVDAVAVEQVARQQHQLYAVIIGVLHHAAGQIAPLLPPLPGCSFRPVKALSRWKSAACRMRTIYASSACQPLHTSTQLTKFLPQQRSSSSQFSSMALAALPTAGNTVSNRFKDTSR